MSKFKTGKQCKRVKNGKRCERSAMRGQEVCYSHGGNAPQNKAAAKRRLAEQAVMVELERTKLTGKATIGTTNPLDELQKLTTELIHFKDQLTQLVNALGDDMAHYDEKGAETLNVKIGAYMKVVEMLTKLLDIALKHDIEGKKIAIEQAKADLVAGLIIRTLIHSGLAGEQLDGAKTYMYQQLKEIGQV